jgi:hypothetical protein
MAKRSAFMICKRQKCAIGGLARRRVEITVVLVSVPPEVVDHLRTYTAHQPSVTDPCLIMQPDKTYVDS